MSSLDSMLNSAATIFTMDLYQRQYRKGTATPRHLLRIGRITTAVFVVIGCLYAPIVARAGSVFQYIQMFWGFISPGIVAAFLFGFLSKRTPPMAALGGMLLGIPVYGLLLWFLPEVAFLHHMLITFVVIALFMAAVTGARPMEALPPEPKGPELAMESSPVAKAGGIAVIIATVVLYVVFW